MLLRSEDSNKRPPGTPGTPGSRDLEAALRRLSLRRDNYLSEKRFFEEERERKLAYLANEEEKGGGGSSGGPGTPTESLFSLCSHPSLGSIWSGYAFTTRSYLPEKLQIVKPLEGDTSSQRHMNTLHNNRMFQKHLENDMKTSDWVFLCSHPIQSENKSQTIPNQHESQYLILHSYSSSRFFECLTCSQKPAGQLQFVGVQQPAELTDAPQRSTGFNHRLTGSSGTAERQFKSAAFLLLQTHATTLLV